MRVGRTAASVCCWGSALSFDYVREVWGHFNRLLFRHNEGSKPGREMTGSVRERR